MRLDNSLNVLREDMFTVSKYGDKYILSAEASELGGFSRLYEDTKELGLTLITNKGNKIKYIYSYALDDEVFVLEPTEESIKRTPKCANSEIHIFND